MKRHRSIHVLTAALAALSLGAGSRAYAQQTSEARIQELVRRAAERVAASAQAGSSVTPAGQAAEPGGPIVHLTLDDAVKAALDHNLDIAVQRINPQTYDFTIASTRAIYKPTLTSTLSQVSNNNPSTQTTSGASVGTAINQGTTTWNGGLSQSVEWGGGSFTAALNNSRQTTTSLTALFDPAYNTNWSASYTQPLLKNFKIDSTRETLVITKLNQDISETQLQATILNTLSNVRNAYWEFVYAQQAVDVAQQTLDLANKLVQDNQTRVEVGTMAPIDVVTARAEQATDRQALVAAQSNRRTTELALKKLIVGGADDPDWTATLDAVDRPDFNPQPVDLDAAVRRALAERTDLQIVRKNVAVNDVTLKFLRNQTLPQTDLTLRYGLIGQGGTSFITSGSGINRVVTGEIPGGYADALSSTLKQSYPAWTLSLGVTYPIGTSTSDASLARAHVQLSQVDLQLKQAELQVANDVTSAVITVNNAGESVQASNASVELAQQKFDAEQSKFDVGMSTNYNVVLAQRDLATARNSQLRAILNYRKALVELERQQQTTLTGSNITILGR